MKGHLMFKGITMRQVLVSEIDPDRDSEQAILDVALEKARLERYNIFNYTFLPNTEDLTRQVVIMHTD